MLDFLEENPDYDQVAMINTKRSNESALARFLKGGFYKFINMISDTKFKMAYQTSECLEKKWLTQSSA